MVYYCEKCKEYYSEDQIKTKEVYQSTLTDPTEYEDYAPCGCQHENNLEIYEDEIVKKLNNK